MKFEFIKKATYTASCLSLAVAGALLSTGVSAAGFEVPIHSVDGLGRAYAGESAVTDNASAIARNPAAAAVVASKSLSLSAVYVKPDVDMHGVKTASLDADDVADEAFVPGLYYVQRFGNFGLGVALKTDYGSTVTYHRSYGMPVTAAPLAGTVAGKTQLITKNYGLHGAYQVTPKLSLGVGVHMVKADAELTRYALGNQVTGFDGHDTGYSWSLGAIYTAAPGHQYAMSYREKVNLALCGTGRTATGAYIPAEGKIQLPEILELSGTNKVANNTSVQYSVAWTRWDRVDALIGKNKNTGANFFGAQHNQDRINTRRYALGVTHDLSSKLAVRAGVAYDEESQKKTKRHLSTPDANRMWYSTGLTYKVTDGSSLDFGMAFVDLKDVTINTPNGLNGANVGPIKQDAKGYLVGAQYNHQF